MVTTGGGLAVGGDVEQALTGIPVPSYVLDTAGIVRWINPAAERLLGDVRGRHFTSVVSAEERSRARELFARKVLGTTSATEATGVLVSTGGARLVLDVSAVPLKDGERVVGVFGLLSGGAESEPSTPPLTSRPGKPRSFASRTKTLDQADRPGAPSEQRDGQEPRPSSPARSA
jgi:PAS domain S-box-containing protein